MKPNYKNWIPKGMVCGAAAGSVVFLALTLVIGLTGLISNNTWKVVLTILFAADTLVFAVATLWMLLMYRAFSYNGRRQMSRHIIDGVASYVTLPLGGRGLDVGCGSGALTIAVAKRNLQASMTGIDRWGLEYSSYSQQLCEDNARAEGVTNVDFAKGDALRLDFADETFDAVTSNYVYHNIPSRDRQAILMETLRVLKRGGIFAIHDIFSRQKYGDMQAFVKKLKDLGYEQVELIPTDKSRFMSAWEARWMALGGSAILVGKK